MIVLAHSKTKASLNDHELAAVVTRVTDHSAETTLVIELSMADVLSVLRRLADDKGFDAAIVSVPVEELTRF